MIFYVLSLLLLIKLGYDDLRLRRLANTWVVAYALIFGWYASQVEFNATQWWAHGLSACLAFLALLALFAVGGMGGGDVKLGSAVMLWAGPQQALQVAVLVAWIGGILAVLGWLADRVPVRHQNGVWVGPVCRALSARRGVPYGVALAGGGIWLVLQQF